MGPHSQDPRAAAMGMMAEISAIVPETVMFIPKIYMVIRVGMAAW